MLILFMVLGVVICAKARVTVGAVAFSLIALVLFIATPVGSGLPDAIGTFVSAFDGQRRQRTGRRARRPRGAGSMTPAGSGVGDCPQGRSGPSTDGPAFGGAEGRPARVWPASLSPSGRCASPSATGLRRPLTANLGGRARCARWPGASARHPWARPADPPLHRLGGQHERKRGAGPAGGGSGRRQVISST
ncbi:hypothetical protein HBB16_14095 [Pseudonocardia sp. MCCB 268]|nr:hypothetical protein [Pseudonocardia cytotoxica]